MQQNENAIALYSRKSKFTGKGESIGNQIELCREYVQLHFGADAAERITVYEDEGFSGGNLNRPAFRQMMESARKHKLQAIIVYRLDRISRNVSDFSGLIEELAHLQVSFISVKEQFDTGTPMGRAMMYIASVFSQLERETIAERIRDNMHELAKTGRWLGGTTPTGFASEAIRSVTLDGKAKKACRLKLIPAEAELVKTVYALYGETDSLTLTESALMKKGLKTKNDRYFTRFSIKSILQNPVYMIADQDAYNFFMENDTSLYAARDDFDGVHGIMAYNRSMQEKGRTTIYLPPKEWIVSVGKHPGLIPGNVWVAVQRSLEQNRSGAGGKPRSNNALLTGLLYCSCGARMYPKLSKRKTPDDTPVCTYVCKRKERSQRALCSGKNVNGNALDAAIIQEMKALQDDRNTFIGQLERRRKLYTGDRAAHQQRLLDMRKEQVEVEKKIHSLVNSLIEIGDSPARAHVMRRMEELHRESQSLGRRIQEQQDSADRSSFTETELVSLRQSLLAFQDGMDKMTVTQKRAAIRAVVRKVVWDGSNAHIVLFGVPDQDIDYPQNTSLSHRREDSK